ncbi:MAG: cytochrome C biogenesis protein CycH, partial [Sphingobacteriales bacterium]
MTNDQIIIYQVVGNDAAIDVQIADDTVWLNQRQMAELFDKDADTIGLHIRNIYKEGELIAEATTEDSSVVQVEGGRNIKRKIKKYNLDVIISVGYRVKSQRGTQFRIWANGILREYLRKGFIINEKKLKEKEVQYEALKKAVKVMGHVLQNKVLTSDEATGLLKVVTDYSHALDILDKYDHQQLTLEGTTDQQLFVATYEEAMQAIKDLKDKFGGSSLFGNEKDDSFKGSIGTIYQSFGGTQFYPTIEEKAANLL